MIRINLAQSQNGHNTDEILKWKSHFYSCNKRDYFLANDNECSFASFTNFASSFSHENATLLNFDNSQFTINAPYKMNIIEVFSNLFFVIGPSRFCASNDSFSVVFFSICLNEKNISSYFLANFSHFKRIAVSNYKCFADISR